jgi:peptide/nickel transport system permease protein
VLTYLLRRVLWMVPTMFGITLLLFIVMQLAPGDPAAVKFGSAMSSGGAGMQQGANIEDAIEKFRRTHRLDEPLVVQYGYWLLRLATLDFGNEYHRPNVEVMDELWQRMKVTVPLSLVSVLLAYLLALPLGILSAVKQGSLADKATTFVLFLLYSIPTFWAGLMLILAFGATGLEWLPVIGLHDKDAEQLQGWDYAWDLVRHCILPVATLTYGGLAYLSRQVFIRTARAKGLSEKVVVFRHALRNSLIPVVTVFATILPILIGGSVIVETVFNIPGMGLYAFQGLITRDYNIVMATVTVSSIMTLLGFLLSDVLYAVVDPRISYD